MTPADRDEAASVAAALLGCVIDQDTEGATVLLGHTRCQVVAQAAVELALWLAGCLEEDPAAFRAELAEVLQRHAL